MSKHNNDASFGDMNIKDKIAAVAGITLLIILVPSFVLGIYFLGLAGVFELLGVQYQSVWSLIVFVVCFFILSMIVELFSGAIFVMLKRKMTGKLKMFFVRISIEGASNWLCLFTVDEFMNSIILSLKTEIVVALLLAAVEIVLDDKMEEEKQNGVE
ncbi:regulatory YrvL family protein [Bacillus sp. DTU_2020_1000418_1_SI_GHA_SEK_038]|uniref:regulatory YrvL family protein n=1 Tax=Bacillus sp. DTU_2020_1000418_1_SI_GHA_SEK_038 TaxID=3077585 RepID=UPI0028E84833|nr:regulatory YrvL family protein [Bacillus sp. DTU_2020_1000418_1_SI_GHA_SEK_038]WNS76197.1 regulatory YrvL family protein [Bacillus sp. DTU_2020_1000418_1_SI_GHA_SEK_038]